MFVEFASDAMPWGQVVRTTILASVITVGPLTVAADEDAKELALGLIEQFYDGLAPNETALSALLGDGFQIIGSDGLRFDRKTYLQFPKAVTSYEISDLVAYRDGDVLTATFEVGYKGKFEGAARIVPHLARMAVFSETGDGWKLQALAALGTGENDVSGKAPDVVTGWHAAVGSGDEDRIRALASPDFQFQRSDGSGGNLDDYIVAAHGKNRPAVVQDLSATSFSNTMIVRYKLTRDGSVSPRLLVFQNIDGKWRTAADTEFPPIE